MPGYRTPLPALLASSLELGLNRILALDEKTPERLARLDGKRVRIELDGLAIALNLAFDRYRVAVRLDADREPDATIRGSPLGFFSMALPEAAADWGSPGSGVSIAGDAGLARDLERLFSRLEPDWEGGLSAWFGEVIGHQVASGARAAATGARATAANLQDMAGEYFAREEAPLARAQDLESFGREVARLRDAVDRLEARIRLLRERGKDPGGASE